MPDHIEAMRRCLLQILEKKGLQFFSLYRAIVGKELRFNGALIWDLETEGRIFTVSEMANGGQKQIIRAIFKRGYHSLPGANQPSQRCLRDKFFRFLVANGRAKQFELINTIFDGIWEASEAAYGGPVYQ